MELVKPGSGIGEGRGGGRVKEEDEEDDSEGESGRVEESLVPGSVKRAGKRKAEEGGEGVVSSWNEEGGGGGSPRAVGGAKERGGSGTFVGVEVVMGDTLPRPPRTSIRSSPTHPPVPLASPAPTTLTKRTREADSITSSGVGIGAGTGQSQVHMTTKRLFVCDACFKYMVQPNAHGAHLVRTSPIPCRERRD